MLTEIVREYLREVNKARGFARARNLSKERLQEIAKMGGTARAKQLSPERMSEIAGTAFRGKSKEEIAAIQLRRLASRRKNDAERQRKILETLASL